MRQVTAQQCRQWEMKTLKAVVTELEKRGLVRYLRRDMEIIRDPSCETSQLVGTELLGLEGFEFTAQNEPEGEEPKLITATLVRGDTVVHVNYTIHYEKGNPRMAAYSLVGVFRGDRFASCSIRHDADGTPHYEHGEVSP